MADEVQFIFDEAGGIGHRQICNQHVARRAPQQFDQCRGTTSLPDDRDAGTRLKHASDTKQNERMIVGKNNSNVH